MTRTLMAALLLFVFQTSGSNAFGYSCTARASGKNCGGTYSGYSSSSKGAAINDALSSCRSSAPANCTCSLAGCSNSLTDNDALDDIINPISEHDHFLGTVTLKETGAHAYPNLYPETNLIRLFWNSAKEKVEKEISADEANPIATRAYPLKTDSTVTWHFICPQGKDACRCTDGRSYGAFRGGAEQAKVQKFHFVVQPARLDVNDMLITRQDGSTYYAKGKYEIDMNIKLNNGHNLSCNIVSKGATKTGVDVLRGFTYTITTTAVSEEGSTLSSTQDYDLR